jgi:hypothetical protein
LCRKKGFNKVIGSLCTSRAAARKPTRCIRTPSSRSS